MRNSLRVWLAFGGAALIAVVTCEYGEPIRTDAAPLLRRVAIPGSVRLVRWRSETLPRDDGCLTVPGPTDSITIFAYLELAAGVPTDAAAGIATITLPDGVADILPTALRRRTVTGPAVRLAPRVKNVTVTAVRLGAGLVATIHVDTNQSE
jgi:hypothetical protein